MGKNKCVKCVVCFSVILMIQETMIVSYIIAGTYFCVALVELLSYDGSLLILGIRFRLPTLPYP